LAFVIFAACVSCAPKNEGEQEIKLGVSEEQPHGIAAEGKPLFATCKTCHGDRGQGNTQLHAPALVNLDSWYLYRQLMNFKNGVRGYQSTDTLGHQMAAMAATLKDSVAIGHVVAYIETLPEAASQVTIIGDIKKGERTYQSICGSCHGPQGKGNKAMNAPRLNGLDDWYLKGQLSKFKNSIRGTHPQDKFGAQMVPMAALLKDEQAVNDVIAYIVSTQPVAE
jgi:cytochrome c oxidase subunit 2